MVTHVAENSKMTVRMETAFCKALWKLENEISPLTSDICAIKNLTGDLKLKRKESRDSAIVKYTSISHF
jgi:hypothetical protein